MMIRWSKIDILPFSDPELLEPLEQAWLPLHCGQDHLHGGPCFRTAAHLLDTIGSEYLLHPFLRLLDNLPCGI